MSFKRDDATINLNIGDIKLPFEELCAKTKADILGELAKRGMWNELLSVYSHIDLNLGIGALHGATFQEWLLTNPDERAFDIWLKIRDRDIRNGNYKYTNYYDSAALIIYADLIKRLDYLTEKEWEGEISFKSLSNEKNIHFNIQGKFQKDIEERLKNRIEFQYHLKMGVNAATLAALRGSVELAKRAIENDKELFFELDIIYDFLVHKNTLSIKPLTKLLKNMDSKSNKNPPLLNSLFSEAISDGLSVEKLQEIWDEMDDKRKTLFINSRVVVSSGTFHKLFLDERLDVVSFIYSLRNENRDGIKGIYDLSTLWSCIEKNKHKSVEFILKRNPDWLESKDWIYKRDGRMGTALTFAVINSNYDMAKKLISYGASITPLIELTDYHLFQDDGERNAGFRATLEKILLENKFNVKHKASAPTIAL